MPPNNRASERGSMMIYIFIGVLLFGMLLYAYTRGTSSSTSMATKGNAKAQALALVDYAEQISAAVQKLQLRGISEKDISFENSVMKNLAGTIYSPASSWPGCVTESCKIFSPMGGNIVPKRILSDLAPQGALNYYTLPGMSQINYNMAVVGVGSNANDFSLMFNTIPKEVCRQINIILGNNFASNPPIGEVTPSDSYHVIGDTPFIGKTAFCYQWVGTNPLWYFYIKVVMPH